MKLLTVSTCLNCIHHDILSCHKRKLRHQSLLDNLRINNQSVYNIEAEIQDSVNGKEAFRNAETLVCRVVQSSLKPLCCRCDRRVQCIDHHISGQGSNSLTSHRISLICHSGRSDLGFLKWLLYFLQMLKKTDIVGHLMCTCSDSRKDIQHTGINLSGIGLSGNRIAGSESHLLCDHRIDLVDGLLIPVKKFQEASLCTGCSLGAKKLHSA